jgi:acyl-homoserine-lactone acylase
METLLQKELAKIRMGSNQFAVSAARSADGQAMMAFDSHMSFYGPFAWMEAHISTPDMSMVGCTVPGLPVIIMGHNGRVSWSSTRNGPDITDVYAFKIHPDSSSQYKGPNGWLTFEQQEQVFHYKSGQETKPVKRTLMFTHIGPVLKIMDGIAYAGRIAGYDSARLLEQALSGSKATTVKDYLDTYRIQGKNMWNILAADTKGNIGYLYNAILPDRDPALDWSCPVDGGDPRSEWKGFVTFEKLPLVINPSSGWLQNCNDPSWYVTTGEVINKEKLPFRLDSGGLGDRGRRVSELLTGNDRITFKEMISYAKDTEVLMARVWVPKLITAYEKNKRSTSLGNANIKEAISLLKSWDYRCDADSRCTALFYYWYKRANARRTVEDSQITDDTARKQLVNLGKAAAEVKDRYGRLDVRWGEILRLRHGDIEVPVSGGGGLFSVVKCAYGRMNRQHKIPVTIGSTYMMVVEMSSPPKAYSCFPIGVDEDPGSKHFADMTYLYSKMEFKPVYYTWGELKPNIESDELLETGLKH